MAKPTTILPMRVTLRDGSIVEACCGPRVTAMDAVAYAPIFERERPGICCHRGVIREAGLLVSEHEAYDYAAVYEALGEKLGDRR